MGACTCKCPALTSGVFSQAADWLTTLHLDDGAAQEALGMVRLKIKGKRGDAERNLRHALSIRKDAFKVRSHTCRSSYGSWGVIEDI